MEGTRPWSLVDAVDAPSRQSSSLEETAHRPWPLPDRSWVMGQTWDDLLFAHWRAPADSLRPLEIHHRPWPFQPAEAVIQENTMPPKGVELLDDDPLLHFSARQDVAIWPLDDA